MAQHVNLVIHIFIVACSICVIVRDKNKKYEMASWLFVGLVNMAFYAGVLFFDMPNGHQLSIIRSQITASIILAYVLGYHILGEKYA